MAVSRSAKEDLRRVAIETTLLRKMYISMVRIRLVEERVGELVESGEIRCPCHLYIGQEAIAAGVCAAVATEDYVWGGHRSHGHYIAKGGSLPGMIAELYGKTTGCARGRGGSMHLLAPEVGILGTVPLVAATIPLSVGAALASKLRDDRRVSVAFFGDGALEEGHFHESMNLAALYRLPVVFVCENNFYASHMSLLERRAADRLEKTGDCHAVPTTRVDGNAVEDIYRSASAAVDQARRGDGPTLLVCDTYRWRGHVGPAFDMDVGVKRNDELKEWMLHDPIARARTGLIARGVPQEELDRVKNDVAAEVEHAVQFARASPLPDENERFEFVFVTSKKQR